MKFEKDPAEARLRNQQNMTPGAPGVGTGSVSIARNSRTASLCREIKIVQDLIERCLQLYMNKDEVVKTLLEQARIQPGFTSIGKSLIPHYKSSYLLFYIQWCLVVITR